MTERLLAEAADLADADEPITEDHLVLGFIARERLGVRSAQAAGDDVIDGGHVLSGLLGP
jgi:hypothetical protein